MSSLSSYCHTYLGGDFPYIVAAVTTILSLAIPIITTNPNVAGIRLTHGAGKENRTLISSLEGWRSTIELHLHRSRKVGVAPTFVDIMLILLHYFQHTIEIARYHSASLSDKH